jgi:hypothetical protein
MGILLSVAVITLFLATTLPVNELSLFVLSSFYVSIIVIEFGIASGWTFYAASSLLSLILPNKLAVLPYILFFGLYGIAKYYIEKVKNVFLAYVLKFLLFNLYLLGAGSIIKSLIPAYFERIPWYAAIIVLEIAFFVYDYAYSLFIQYYHVNLKKFFKV